MAPRSRFVPERDYVLWQLPSFGDKTSMSYVICGADGTNFVIDGGLESDTEYLEKFLFEHCDGVVHAWFVTHPHPGHVGALCGILKNKPEKLKIGKIFYVHIPLDVLEVREPKSTSQVAEFYTLLRSSDIPCVSMRTGDRLKIGKTMIRVFSAGETDCTEHYVDNMGAVLKFNMYCTTAVFLGDIRVDASIPMLEKYKNELGCDIIQMSNHGLKGVLSEVYGYAEPDTCLWSTPECMADESSADGRLFCEHKRLMEVLGAGEHFVSGLEGPTEIHIAY